MKNVSLSCVKSALPDCPCFSMPASDFCIRDKLVCSIWEYMVTFSCYRGSGCHWPGCRARGSIHSAMHSLSQARGSEGTILDSALPSKVWYGPPPHSYFQGLLCAAVHTFSSCPLLLQGCCRVEHKQACQVGWDVSLWSTLGSWYKHHLCSPPEAQIILSVSRSKGEPRLMSQGFFYLLIGFDISLEL